MKHAKPASRADGIVGFNAFIRQVPLPMPMLTVLRCEACPACLPLLPDMLHAQPLVTMIDPVHGAVRYAWPMTLHCPACGNQSVVKTGVGERQDILAPSVVLASSEAPRSAFSADAIASHLTAVHADDAKRAPVGTTARALSVGGSVCNPPPYHVRSSTARLALKAAEAIEVYGHLAIGGADLFPCLACGNDPATLFFDATLKAQLRRIVGGFDMQFYTAGQCVLPDDMVQSLTDFYNHTLKKLPMVDKNTPGSTCDGHHFVAGGKERKKAKFAVIGVFAIVCRHGAPYYLIQMQSNETLMYHVVGVTLAFATNSNASSDIICMVLRHIRRYAELDADYLQNYASRLWPAQTGAPQHSVRLLAPDSAHAVQPEPWSLNSPLSVTFGPAPPPGVARFFQPSLPSAAAAAVTGALPAMHTHCHSLSCNSTSGSSSTARAFFVPEAAEWVMRQLGNDATSFTTLSPGLFRLMLEQYASLARFDSNEHLPSKLLRTVVAAFARRSLAHSHLCRAAAAAHRQQPPGLTTTAWLETLDALVLADADSIVKAKEVSAALAATTARHSKLAKLRAAIAALSAALFSCMYRVAKPISEVMRLRYIAARAGSAEVRAVSGADTLDEAVQRVAGLQVEADGLEAVIAEQDEAAPEPTLLQLLHLHAADLHAQVHEKGRLTELITQLQGRLDKSHRVLTARKAAYGAVCVRISTLLAALKQLCALSDNDGVKDWCSQLPAEASLVRLAHLTSAPACMGPVTGATTDGVLAQAIRQFHVAAAEVQACRAEVDKAHANAQLLTQELRLRFSTITGADVDAVTLESASGSHGMFLRPGCTIGGRPVLLHVADASQLDAPSLQRHACALRSVIFAMAQRWGGVARRLQRLQAGVSAVFNLPLTSKESFTCHKDANAAGGRVLLEMRAGDLLAGTLSPAAWAQLALGPGNAGLGAAGEAAGGGGCLPASGGSQAMEGSDVEEVGGQKGESEGAEDFWGGAREEGGISESEGESEEEGEEEEDGAEVSDEEAAH